VRGALLGVVAAVVAGCYRPTTEQPCSVICGPGASCPAGLTCNNGVCTSGGACPVDAPVVGDVPIDDPPGQACYGVQGGLFRACFPAAPSMPMDLTQNLVINTDSDPACDVRPTATGPVCVIARSTIRVGAGFSIRGYGSRPLVLISVGNFDVQGTIDVSSGIGAASTRGAGGNPASCQAPTGALLDGGGAGGSFGTIGGEGGGGNGQSFGGVPAAAPPTITTVRGGCPGGVGQGNSGAVPGSGGGAVYLITPARLILDGGINASGGPGTGGGMQHGGQGGGAGGLVGIDAPTLEGAGYVLADGGGAGCGGDNVKGGAPGTRSLHNQPPVGCTSDVISGGAGAWGTNPAEPGMNGGAGQGGGGGGGGAGIIVLFPPTLVIADRSPPAGN
jgi:hypothetical protein